MKILTSRQRIIKQLVILCIFSIAGIHTSLSQFKNFVSTKNDKLMDGNIMIRFISYNIPNLHYIEDNYQFTNPNPWRLPDEFEIRDALTAIKLSGGNVTRMYTLSIRKQNDEKDIIRHIEGRGKFNEDAFKAIDKVLQIANEVGVRVIIPIVDNWKWWGEPTQLAAFRGKKREEFWTDSLLISDFKQIVSFYVNRVNSFTGIPYKEDKAILCWETGNELECPFSWTKQIAAHIKSLDTNHLVMEGTHAQQISLDALNDPNIDIVSTHHYSSMPITIERITKNRSMAKNHKPYIVGEFGYIPLQDMRAVLDTVINTGISGIMVWSMRSRNSDGGFYYHGNEYRYPGFYEGENWTEPAVMKLFKEKGNEISGREVHPDPVPAVPTMLPIEDPYHISWRGSTGASSYIVERRDDEGGSWKVVSQNASDAGVAYRSLFSDNSAEVGKSYSYRVKAKNESGVSEPSVAVGPVRTDYLMVIDEMETDEKCYGRMGSVQFLNFQDVIRAKEDRSRIEGKDGGYLLYKIPEKISSLQIDIFKTKNDAKDITIMTGNNVESLKPLSAKKTDYPNYFNEYNFFLPTRYSTATIPSSHRFIKINLRDYVQISRIEVKYHQGNFSLASIFSDEMVLQQKRLVPIWGTGIIGAEVKISGSWGKSASTIVDASGKWMVKLQTPKAGGPYELKIQQSDSALVLKNILVGEVWLASGQSNMEMPLTGWPPRDTIMNSANEIARANYPNIRFFTVQRNFSTTPIDYAKGSWEVSTPQNASHFSATAFFFSKKLHQDLHIPIGIIHSSWGGTPVEAWMSAGAMSKYDEYAETMRKIEENKKDEKKLSEWLNSFSSIDMSKRTGETKWMGLEFNDKDCSNPDYPDTTWKEMNLPTLWERTELGDIDGVVWFRKTIDIPQSWVHKKIQLHIGMIDDADITFVNGTKVGGYEKEGFWSTHRNYLVPDSLIQSTRMTIAVRVIDFQGGGGIYGDKSLFSIQLDGTDEIISIVGNWKYLPVAIYRNSTMYVLGTDINTISSRPQFIIEPSAYIPTTLFNAMINPLLPFSIRGAIWYQGESNVGREKMYAKLFPEMITEWREKFQCGDFPFYYVQIAPWRYSEGTHSEYLREAQLSTLKLKNTGMAVTLDIGDNNTIHPANKTDVGERLARWALVNEYRKKLIPSGPVYKSNKTENGSMILSFDYVGKGLKFKPKDFGSEFSIAGNDSVFKEAQVEVKGKSLRVFHPDIKNPLAVRYAFTDTSSATLFNSDDLPASSFRTDSWKR